MPEATPSSKTSGAGMFLGVCKPPLKRLDLVRAAGLEWLRYDVPFPFAGAMGKLSDRYGRFRELARTLHFEGFKLMGLTPYPHGWRIEGAGEPGGEAFLDNYRQACAFLARDLAGLVVGWQISNEMNLEHFRQPLTVAQCAPFLIAGGQGVREGNPDALLGVNMATGHEYSAPGMYAPLYANDHVDWDYVGMDAYYGTWEPGGPDTWREKLEALYKLARKPIIVQEFGYSSHGGTMTGAERPTGKEYVFPHLHRADAKWAWGWGAGHNAEVQGEYATRVLDILAATPEVLGAIWYKWDDDGLCECGHPECPGENHWGLVDERGEPKPAYHAVARWSAARRKK